MRSALPIGPSFDWNGQSISCSEPELASHLIANAFEQSKQYHWDAVREQWLAVYRSMLGGAVRPARNSPDPVAESAELAEPVNPNR